MGDVGDTTPAAEGWYPDPDSEDYQRFWDGRGWTDMRSRRPTHPDRVRVKRIATLIGVACLVVFLLATFLPTTVAGVSCGTWISPEKLYSTTGSAVGSILASAANQECADKLETRRLIALIALGVGLAGRFGLPYAMQQKFDM